MKPRNRFQGINSTSLCSLAGRYDNPIPTRCLTPIDFLKIPAQAAGGPAHEYQSLPPSKQCMHGREWQSAGVSGQTICLPWGSAIRLRTAPKEDNAIFSLELLFGAALSFLAEYIYINFVPYTLCPRISSVLV
jgi:hypothetical protein